MRTCVAPVTEHGATLSGSGRPQTLLSLGGGAVDHLVLVLVLVLRWLGHVAQPKQKSCDIQL